MEIAATSVRRKWDTLEHKGIAFPPEYQPRGISIIIRGEKLMLNRDQEELAYAWANKKDTHYVHDSVFQSNFLIEFKKLLPAQFQDTDNITDIDFSEAFRLIDRERKTKDAEKERIRNLSPEEKKKLSLSKREEREKLKAIYGKAIIDGTEVDIANWLVEPPGLFMGRGQHPLRGKWKPRIRPHDVTLNLGEDAPVPEGPWHRIVHDHSSMWIATWMDKLTAKRKYVWLHDSSVLRQNNDKEKYDKAAKLGRHIDKVQKGIINRMLRTRDANQRKIATVCYLIFKLAMRVGDEKDPEEADTVGASTLRVEHIKFPNKNGKQFIEFNFLGKDSVPWQKTLEVNSEDTRGLYNNLRLFMNGKESGSHIFDGITSGKVNAFLRSIDPKNVPGLTAKVFRTYIATKTLRESLINPPITVNKNSSQPEKIYVAKIANLKAAITCNHKKGIDLRNPTSKKTLERFEESIRKKRETSNKLKSEIASKKWKTEIQKRRLEERLNKVEMQLKLQIETRDYNLGTSLRNYIDPRVMKDWLNYVNLDWNAVYTATLRRKFKWAEDYSKDSNALHSVLQTPTEQITVVQEETHNAAKKGS
ncbi:MAG: DNA topoisomerase I [Nitrososphaeraceae archaeon]